MIKNKSIKFKLLLHYIIVQIFLFIIFGSILIYMLKASVIDKIETNLKVVTLDIKDDIIEHNRDIYNFSLDEEIDEFQIKPLHIKIVKDEEIIQTQNFPKSIIIDNSIVEDKIYFKHTEDIMVSTIKFSYENTNYLLQIATNIKHLPEIFPNLKYIFLFIAPIVLLFAIIFGNFIISRSFKSIENLLMEIKNISAKSLSSRVSTNNRKDEIDEISIEVNKLLDRVEKSYTQISQFTSDVSHELKTPLTILRGELELSLKEQRINKEYHKTLKSSLEEILNIQSTIENLLFLAKMENSELELDEVIYLDELLLDTIKDLNPLFAKKNCKLNLSINDAISIKGKDNLFKIVFKNIIENAVFYSNENSNINISLNLQNKIAYLEVEDFGLGMDNKTIKNIYEKFYRGDTSRSKHTGGTGLGMSIVKKIIDLHGVNINIKSVENQGTKITLIFKHLDF